MIFKNILRIFKSYQLSLIVIIFYELLYFFKGNKGNNFTFSNIEGMTDNIPCPYYFLYKINKKIKNINFNLFIDLGSGSGRVIDFFNKKFENKNFIGIEYFDKQFLYCKENFKKYKNIKFIQEDLTKYNFLQYNADCYFLNEPINIDKSLIGILKQIKESKNNKGSILLILVNCNKNVLKCLEDLQCIETFYINDKKGYSIYYINNK